MRFTSELNSLLILIKIFFKTVVALSVTVWSIFLCCGLLIFNFLENSSENRITIKDILPKGFNFTYTVKPTACK